MRILLIMLGFLTLSGPAYAFSMGVPIGYRGLCNHAPQFCQADRAVKKEVPPIPYTSRLKRLLSEVNTRWNTRIRPITDEDKFNEREVWVGATDEGDCEEYAIAKKMELLSLGYSASQLLYAVVNSKYSKTGHLVLVVRTSAGNFVLDNEDSRVLLWEEARYPHLHSHQRADAPSLWENDLFILMRTTSNS